MTKVNVGNGNSVIHRTLASIKVMLNGFTKGTRNIINFISGSNISISASDDGEKIDITITSSAAGSGSGDVTGPSSATDGDLVIFDGATGKLIADFGVKVSGYIKTLLDDGSALVARSTLGVAIGTNVQAYNDILTALAGLTGAANKLPYFTGTSSMAVSDLSAFILTLLDDTDAATARATIGLGSVDNTSIIGTHDIWIPASAMWPRTTSGCQAITKREQSTSLVNQQTLNFDATSQEFAQWITTLPRNWDNGTVTIVVYWTCTGGGTSGVVWGLSGGAYSDSDLLTTALGTAQTATDSWIADNKVHVSPATSAITIAGSPADGDMLVFQISRNPSDASDTLSVDAELLGVSLRITTDAGKAA